MYGLHLRYSYTTLIRKAGQSEQSGIIGRGALKRQELKQSVRETVYIEGLHKGPV